MSTIRNIFYSPKLSLYLLASILTLFILHQIRFLHNKTTLRENIPNYSQELKSMTEKLRQSITFLPVKDLRYAHKPLQGHTWFMSSTFDTHEEGEVQYQHYPSQSSKGRLLCLKGNNTHDGSWNTYVLAWPDALPHNATLMKGLTFVSYNHYDYGNIWHGLSAMVPFVAWHIRNQCATLPRRWVLYHWGELRFKMGAWLSTLMEATFNGAQYIENFNGDDGGKPICFEEAVVMRHNEGGMSKEKRMEVYDLMRCKARIYCNVSLKRENITNEIGMTLFMRTGARSFKNESAVTAIFRKECAKVEGCRLVVAHSNNLSFCEQVELMSLTDILISPHGAQLTNIFLMNRNSSVMEFFPKGWLKLAGIGQYVYHWIASWSGMTHQGAWRDPHGENCGFLEDDHLCMSIYKNGKIGYNETYFAGWIKIVLNEVRIRKMEEKVATTMEGGFGNSTGCGCGIW